MWVKSDTWGTINWGQLSQATDNVALLPDLSGTVIEANAVLFDGQGMFIRTKGAKNSNDLGRASSSWGGVVTCLTAGGGIGADCNGYPANAFRYDTPTWAGFSVSTSYGEDDMWDVAVKYAADWNSVKFSAAAGYTQVTDEGCLAVRQARPAPTSHCWVAVERPTRTSAGMRISSRSARPSCTFHQACSFMACIRASRTTGPSGKRFNFNTGQAYDSAANETDVWYVKAGIKRAWSPVGATVLFGEWGQYNDMFTGLCGLPGISGRLRAAALCATSLPIGTFAER